MLLTIYVLISVLIVSLISLVGILTFSIKSSLLEKLLLFLVSLSVGSLFGEVFLHLLPEINESQLGYTLGTAFSIIGGIFLFFIIERFVHWRHCHIPVSEHHHHHLATMNLVGDGIHNFIDGLIIAASYLVSIPLGIATTLAVILHEIPQEFADFGVLLYAGLSKWRALIFNFLSAVLAILGAIVGLIIGSSSEVFLSLILPFAAGGFIYIAGSDLIPELHQDCPKETFWQKSSWNILAILLGIFLMYLLTFLEL